MEQNKKKTSIKSEAVVKKKNPLTVYKLQKELKMLKKSVEKKALTYQYTSSNVDSTTGTIASLCANITPGTDFQSRIGMKINIKYIQFNIWVYNNATSTLSGQGAFDLMLDRNPTGTLPAITDIFSDGNPTRLIYYGYKGRFKSLYHQHFTYDSYTLSNEGKVFDVYRKVNLETLYSGTAGTIADLAKGKNDLLIVFRSSNSSVGSTSYGVVSNFRVAFTDS